MEEKVTTLTAELAMMRCQEANGNDTYLVDSSSDTVTEESGF